MNAFVFVADSNVLRCLRVAVYSCKQHNPDTDILVYAMDDLVANDPAVQKHCRVIREQLHPELGGNTIRGITYGPIVANKIIVFKNNYGYDKLCYLDADVVVRRSAEDIFSYSDDKFYALPVRKGSTKYAAGPIWLFSGSDCGEQVYNRMVQMYHELGSFWEELLVTTYFRPKLEFLDQSIEHLRGVPGRASSNPIFIHYAGPKPYDVPDQENADIWFAIEEEINVMPSNRYAVAVMTDSKYLPGARVTAFSVKETSPGVDVVVLTRDPAVLDDTVLAKYADWIVLIDNDDALVPFRAWRTDFPQVVAEKMAVFRESFGYEQLCLMDADAIAIKDLNPLFEDHPDMLRGIQTFIKGRKHVIHGGMLFIPSRLLTTEAYDHLIDTCKKLNSTWEEQAILEAFEKDIHFIPADTMFSPRSKLRVKFTDNTRVLHYISTKPWLEERDDCGHWYACRDRLMQSINGPVVAEEAPPVQPRERQVKVIWYADKGNWEFLALSCYMAKQNGNLPANTQYILYTLDKELADNARLKQLFTEIRVLPKAKYTHYLEPENNILLGWRLNESREMQERYISAVFNKFLLFMEEPLEHDDDICIYLDWDNFVLGDISDTFPDWGNGHTWSAYTTRQTNARRRYMCHCPCAGLLVKNGVFNRVTYPRLMEIYNGTDYVKGFECPAALDEKIYYIYTWETKNRDLLSLPVNYCIGPDTFNPSAYTHNDRVFHWYGPTQPMYSTKTVAQQCEEPLYEWYYTQVDKLLTETKLPERRDTKAIWFIQDNNWEPVAVSCQTMRDKGELPDNAKYILYTCSNEVLNNKDLRLFFDEIKPVPQEAYSIIPPLDESDQAALDSKMPAHESLKLDIERKAKYRTACYLKFWLFVNEPLDHDDDICIYVDWDCFIFGDVKPSFPYWHTEGKTWAGAVFSVFSPRSRKRMCRCPMAAYLVKNGAFNIITAPRLMQLAYAWDYVDNFECRTILDEKIFTIYTFETKNRDTKDLGWEWGCDVKDFILDKYYADLKVFHWVGVDKPFVNPNPNNLYANQWYTDRVRAVHAKIANKQKKPKIRAFWYNDKGDWRNCALSALMTRRHGNLPEDTEYLLYTNDPATLNDPNTKKFFDRVAIPVRANEIIKELNDLDVDLTVTTPIYRTHDPWCTIPAEDKPRRCTGWYTKLVAWLVEPMDDIDLCMYMDWDAFPVGDLTGSYPTEGSTMSAVTSHWMAAPFVAKGLHVSTGYLIKNKQFDTAGVLDVLYNIGTHIAEFSMPLNDIPISGDEIVMLMYFHKHGYDCITPLTNVYSIGHQWTGANHNPFIELHLERGLSKIIHFGGPYKPWYNDGANCIKEANEWYRQHIAIVDEMIRPKLFDKVYVVNMDKRADRWEQFQQEIKAKGIDFGVPIERFSALDGSKFSTPEWWGSYHGSWGCYLSHRHLIERCINDDSINNVLILQDDVTFIDNFMEEFTKFHEHLPEDAEWVYYGGQHLRADEKKPVIINDYVCKPYNVNRMHMFAFFGKDIMRKVHQHLSHSTPWPRRHNTDHMLGMLHETGEHKVYVPMDWLAFQRDGYSDLMHKHVDHRKWGSARTIAVREDLPPKLPPASKPAPDKATTDAIITKYETIVQQLKQDQANAT